MRGQVLPSLSVPEALPTGRPSAATHRGEEAGVHAVAHRAGRKRGGEDEQEGV